MRYLYIVLTIVFTLCASGCTSQTPTNEVVPTPRPLPTARPLIASSQDNAKAISNSLPASIGDGGELTEFGLNNGPFISNEGGYWQIKAEYGGIGILGRVGGDAEIKIFPDEDRAISEFQRYRSSEGWAWDYEDQAISNDSFAVVRLANVVLVLEGHELVENDEIEEMAEDVIRSIQNPSVLTIARQPIVAPTSTIPVAPYGSGDITPTKDPSPASQSPNNDTQPNIINTILNILRDNAWAGIGVLVAIALFLLGGSKK